MGRPANAGHLNPYLGLITAEPPLMGFRHHGSNALWGDDAASSLTTVSFLRNYSERTSFGEGKLANALAFTHSATRRFLAANGALFLALASLAFSSEARSLALAHPFIAIISLIIVELVVIIGLWAMYHTGADDDVFSSTRDEISREKTTMRFGHLGDNWGIERVYDEWFSSKLEMDGEEYCKILNRGKFVRVAEITTSDGGEKATKIAGYYAIFPISQENFSALCSGSLSERNIQSNMVLDPDNSKAEVLYVCELVSSKKCDVRIALVGDLKSYVLHILAENDNIVKIGTWPYTKYGRKLVRNLEMQLAGGSTLFHRVYQLPRSRLAGFRGRVFKSSHTTFH